LTVNPPLAVALRVAFVFRPTERDSKSTSPVSGTTSGDHQEESAFEESIERGGARYIDAPIVRFHDGNGDGDLLDVEDNIRYYTGDANSNVTATLDFGTGKVVDRYVYGAYGKATVYDDEWTNPAATATDGPLYCGYFFDAETALYQVRNRYYDAVLSTFISRDPIGYASGINLYEYVGNGPVNSVDPLGLWFGPCTTCLRPTPIVARPTSPLKPILVPRPPVPMPMPVDQARPSEPRPVGPNPNDYRPGYPSKKPWKCPETRSDCTENQLAHLTSQVERKCPDHGFITLPAPRKIWFVAWRYSCEQMEDLKDKWQECAEARREREYTCFRGGDRGHQVQLAQAQYHVQYAYYLLRLWGCPGYEAGTDVLGRPIDTA